MHIIIRLARTHILVWHTGTHIFVWPAVAVERDGETLDVLSEKIVAKFYFFINAFFSCQYAKQCFNIDLQSITTHIGYDTLGKAKVKLSSSPNEGRVHFAPNGETA